MNQLAVKNVDEKYCCECGSLIRAKAEICPHCGVRQHGAGLSTNFGPSTSTGKNKIAAALFALFLGGFGAHKFYLGQTGMGIVYLLFFWTGIPALIAFIEFILLLTMTDRKFVEKFEPRLA